MWLETNRLTVRDFTPDDARALHAILSDREVMRFIEAPFSGRQTQTFLREAGLCDPPLVFAVLWKKTGELIGHLIWHPWDETSMELGWILRRDVWGKGVAKELTEAMLAQTAKDVVIECSPEQATTIHIAELFGFARGPQEDKRLLFRIRAEADTRLPAETKRKDRKKLAYNKDFWNALDQIKP